MKPPRKPPVRPLDLGLRRTLLQTENDVEIQRLFFLFLDDFRVDHIALRGSGTF